MPMTRKINERGTFVHAVTMQCVEILVIDQTVYTPALRTVIIAYTCEMLCFINYHYRY